MTIDTPIGPLAPSFDQEGQLLALVFASTTVPSAPPPPTAAASLPTQPLADLSAQLRDYFAGRRKAFTIALAPRGTPFQLAVWNALLEIPYGETISYAELARRVGKPSAVRPVGAANGANPIPLIIPCHRVIGTNGRLTGYGGGIERKQWLLAREGQRLF